MEIHQLTEASEQYPPLLREVHQPPKQLFVRGNVDLLSHETLVAVVGSRRATNYGKQCVEKLFTDVVQADIPLVSGLAYGIDALAHKLCVERNKSTIAVLGSGIDDESIYPRRHISLAHHILENGGAIVSEYEPGTPAYPGQFPARNRIVAGLSVLTVVVQAAKRSGSLITARLALEAGREVAAVPGPITDTYSQGTNQLIASGAMPLCSAEEVLQLLGKEGGQATPTATLNLTIEQQEVVQVLSLTPRHVDEIIEDLSKPSEVVVPVLTELELLGAVQHVGGMKYVSLQT